MLIPSLELTEEQLLIRRGELKAQLWKVWRLVPIVLELFAIDDAMQMHEARKASFEGGSAQSGPVEVILDADREVSIFPWAATAKPQKVGAPAA